MENFSSFLSSRIFQFLPFLETFQNYNFEKFRKDLIAGLTVAIVALPQSMAYAMIAGVNPKYGLYAAIIPTIIASLFGSSQFLIAGPTNAISMVISSSLASAAIAGTVADKLPEDQKIAIVFLLAFLVGVIQIIMGIAKLGNLINFVSRSVVVGFSAGAGILIAFNQLKNFLGIKIPSTPEFIETLKNTFTHLGETNETALAIGLFTIIFILLANKISKKIPGPLLAMVLSAIGVLVFKLDQSNLKLIGDIPQTLPPLSNFPFSLQYIRDLFMPALAIALLGVVEALSIAKSIANTSREKIDGSQEFIGQGLSNLSAAFFSSIPGSGSFTRSAVNFSSGAKTRIAGILSGIFVLLTLLVFAPYAKFIPIASLAGILMLTAYSMVDQKAIAMAYKTTRSDRIVMLATLFSTLFLELEFAVYVGVILSIILFLRKVSKPQVNKVVPRLGDNKMIIFENDDTRHCPQISIFQIDGPLFFGAINEMETRFNVLNHSQIGKVVILRIRGVQILDATGVNALEMFINDAKSKGKKVIFTNVCANVYKSMQNSGMLKEIGEENIAEDTTAAITLAYQKYIDCNFCQTCRYKVFTECHLAG